MLSKIPGIQALTNVIRRRIDRVVDERVDQRLRVFINQESDPALLRMATGWASCLQPGASSPHAFLGSSLCRMEDIQHPRYRELCQTYLAKEPIFHRKQWEYIYIIEKLRQNGSLKEGAKGLGFGVGTEPLASFFVSQGCFVLATDAPEDLAIEGWKNTAQHSANKESLWNSSLVSKDLFEERCCFLPLDMNSYSDIPTGYDFHWSSCVIEHLGGIRHAIDFVSESVDRLAPGGVAVHTTEFNLSSDSETVDEPGTCILRGSDVTKLMTSLRMRGFDLDPLILDPGSHPFNFHVDTFPYQSAVHLRLQLDKFASTSLGLVIRKPLG